MEEIKKEETKAPEKSEGGKNTTMAIIAYIIFFIPLLTESKSDPFVKFHVKQSILLVIISVLNAILGTIIAAIWFFIGPIVSLGVFILLIIGIVNAANGKTEPLPVVGKYAEQYLKF